MGHIKVVIFHTNPDPFSQEKRLERELLPTIEKIQAKSDDDIENYFRITLVSQFSMLIETAPMGFVMYFWFGQLDEEPMKTIIYSTNQLKFETIEGSIPKAFEKFVEDF